MYRALGRDLRRINSIDVRTRPSGHYPYEQVVIQETLSRRVERGVRVVLAGSTVLLGELLLVRGIVKVGSVLRPPIITAYDQRRTTRRVVTTIDVIGQVGHVIQVRSRLVAYGRGYTAYSGERITLSNSSYAYTCDYDHVVSYPNYGCTIFEGTGLAYRVDFRDTYLLATLVGPEGPLLSCVTCIGRLL